MEKIELEIVEIAENDNKNIYYSKSSKECKEKLKIIIKESNKLYKNVISSLEVLIHNKILFEDISYYGSVIYLKNNFNLNKIFYKFLRDNSIIVVRITDQRIVLSINIISIFINSEEKINYKNEIDKMNIIPFLGDKSYNIFKENFCNHPTNVNYYYNFKLFVNKKIHQSYIGIIIYDHFDKFLKAAINELFKNKSFDPSKLTEKDFNLIFNYTLEWVNNTIKENYSEEGEQQKIENLLKEPIKLIYEFKLDDSKIKLGYSKSEVCKDLL